MVIVMVQQEEINNYRERLTIHRRNLAQLLLQEARHSSGYVPISIINAIHEQRCHIARIKHILRVWGEAVDDYPDDDPPSFIYGP